MNDFEKVLIISYHFPPAIGPGVPRVLKFAKFLPCFGYLPVILTTNPINMLPENNELLRELHPKVTVIRDFSFERDRYEKKSKLMTGFFKFFDFLLIPDDQALWRLTAVKKAIDIIKKEKIKIIFSTAPPFSVHNIALSIKKKTDVKWISDFRDEWAGFNPYFNNRGRSYYRTICKMEKNVVEFSDAVISVNEDIIENFKTRYNRQGEKFFLIPNGFDAEDFEGIIPIEKKKPLRLVYTGSLYDKRSPEPFLCALKEALTDNMALKEQLEIIFAGNFTKETQKMLSEPIFNDLIYIKDYLNFRETLSLQASADLLLLIIDNVDIAERIYTGKFFEYLGAKKPILAIGKKGTKLENIFMENKLGFFCGFNEIEAIKSAIIRLLSGNINYGPSQDNISKFSRRNQAGLLAQIMRGL